MKIGIILNTNDPETCWNCFRFGNEALAGNHSVKIFLLGKGVEIENIQDNKFPLFMESIKKFLKNKGIILACGTCVKVRGNETKICLISTMEELLQIVEVSDKVLVFG